MDHRTIVSFFTCQLVWVNRYAPRAWQQMLRLMSDQPPEQLRRIGGCLVVAGAVILWALAH